MPVKCYRRTDKQQRKYTTCKDETTGNQLRGGARPTGRPRGRRAPARRAAPAPARARRTSAPATQPVRRSNRVAARR